MITQKDINLAVNISIKEYIKSKGLNIPIIDEDIKEAIKRPSLKVTFENNSSSMANNVLREKSTTCRIYFFAKNKNKPKLENIEMQEIIETVFLNQLVVKNNFIIPIDSVNSEIIDGVLVCNFDLNILEQVVQEIGEIMEKLEYRE